MNIHENGTQPTEAMPLTSMPIGEEQIRKFTQILQKYKAGKTQTESRIVSSESWWKLRNTTEEQKETKIGKDGGFTSRSGWLHNVIVSKHADAMEAFPEPNILPREKNDREEAKKLSSIIPCVLEQNRFEATYSDVMWQKLKTGTGVYKIVWDTSKLNGLGDIAVERVNLLNIYWEPGITDIQNSRYLFHTELCDRDVLEQRYPELEGKLKGNTFIITKFLYDDHVDTENKVTVIDVYYHKYVDGRKTLQYCKYVGDTILFATENDMEMAARGLYDHGRYPYVFDPLFPIEGSPCGYGYVDICRNPQTEIDLMKTAFLKNVMVGAVPRYFFRGKQGEENGINEDEFLDLSKPIVHGKVIDENSLRRIEYSALDGSYLSMLDRTVQELRETSGNTETSTGNVSSGVTAASAIAALQEASGKGSRDSTQTSYRAFADVVSIAIELIRQFYDAPRQFRILGQYGQDQYISYTNKGILPQNQNGMGQRFGDHLPVFDIKISAQKKNAYTKVAQNELSIQLFKMGFFDPQMTNQALMCLDMMDFDGKDEIMQKIAQNGTLFDKLTQYMQLSLTFAKIARPDMVSGISADIMQTLGASAGNPLASIGTKLPESDNIAGIGKTEPKNVKNARENARKAGGA